MTHPTHADSSFAWTAHPLRERPAAGVGGAMVMLAVALGAAHLGGTAWWAAGALLLQLGALRRFYLPSHFRLDAEGITARSLLQRQHCRWSQVQRFVHDRRGGFLSRRPAPSPLDPWGGMHVLFGTQAEQAIGRIRGQVAPVHADGTSGALR